MIFNPHYVSAYTYVPQHAVFGYVDCRAVHVRPTAELTQPGKTSSAVSLPGVSVVELSSNLLGCGVASTSSPPARLSVTTVRDRMRRTDATSESPVISRSSVTQQSVERRRRLYCSLCRVKLNADQQAEQHYRGKLHTKKSKKLALNTTNDAADTQCSGGTEDGNGTQSAVRRDDAKIVGCRAHVYCNICATSFNSDKQSEQHYRGKLHAKKLRLARYLTRVRFSDVTN